MLGVIIFLTEVGTRALQTSLASLCASAPDPGWWTHFITHLGDRTLGQGLESPRPK